MNPTAVSMNGFMCGAVAAATLCAAHSRDAVPAETPGVGFAERTPAPAALPEAPAPRGWLAGLVDLVSGPAPVRA